MLRYIVSLHAKIGANRGSEVSGALYVGRIASGKRKSSSGVGLTSKSVLAAVTSAHCLPFPQNWFNSAFRGDRRFGANRAICVTTAVEQYSCLSENTWRAK